MSDQPSSASAASDREIVISPVFVASHASMNQGWGGTFDQLSTYLGDVQAAP